jgi:hypothetical protein
VITDYLCYLKNESVNIIHCFNGEMKEQGRGMKGIKERQREGIKDEGMKEIIFC